jgi:hypothetical protein
MTDTAHHIDRETYWITDAELIRRMGAPEKKMRVALRMLDKDPRSGFPKKQGLYGDRRYWPAVKAYFDRMYGPRMDAPRRERP